MAVTVTDVAERTRYEARVDGELGAFADDDTPAGELSAFTHTEVLLALKGKGIGRP